MSGPAFVVRILGPGGRPAGAGALVAARRILTCAHVVNLALGRDPGSREQPAEAVTVDFPFAAPGLAARGGLGYQATVGFWLPPPRDGALGADVAGLFLTDADAAELRRGRCRASSRPTCPGQAGRSGCSVIRTDRRMAPPFSRRSGTGPPMGGSGSTWNRRRTSSLVSAGARFSTR